MSGTAGTPAAHDGKDVRAVVTHEGDWYVARTLGVEVTSQGVAGESSRGVGAVLRGPALPRDCRGRFHRRCAGHPPVGVTPALPRVCGAKVVRALGRAGFEEVATRGSHCSCGTRRVPGL